MHLQVARMQWEFLSCGVNGPYFIEDETVITVTCEQTRYSFTAMKFCGLNWMARNWMRTLQFHGNESRVYMAASLSDNIFYTCDPS